MNSRIRAGLETWAAAAAAATSTSQPASEDKRKTKTTKKEKGEKRFGLRYVDSPSAGLRYKILTCVCCAAAASVCSPKASSPFPFHLLKKRRAWWFGSPPYVWGVCALRPTLCVYPKRTPPPFFKRRQAPPHLETKKKQQRTYLKKQLPSLTAHHLSCRTGWRTAFP
jgi:hypothetical protein